MAFNAQNYLNKYPDVKKLKMDAEQHYEKYGKALGRDDGTSAISNKVSTVSNKVTVNNKDVECDLDSFKSANKYWTSLLYKSLEHRKWFIATAIKTKSINARDLLASAATNGKFQNYALFEEYLERIRVESPSTAEIKKYKMFFWRPGLRGLARVLYSQRSLPFDLLNSFSIYKIILHIWGRSGVGDEVDISYLADLYVEHGLYKESIELLEKMEAKQAERKVSRSFMKLNAINPFLEGSVSTLNAWINDLNKIYSSFGFSEIKLDKNYDKEKPFLSLDSDAPFLTKDLPLVSVIVPVYEPDEATDLAIKSLLKQSWTNLEIIIVDDASPMYDANGKETNYEKFYEKWEGKDQRLKILRLDINKGAYYARNIGFEKATGEFVTVADKDDWQHPQKIEYQAMKLLSDPESKANMVNWVRVSETLRFLLRWGPDKVVCPTFASLMYKTSELRSTFGYWDDVRKSADGEMKFRYQTHFGINIQPDLPLPLAFSLMGEGNLTAQDLGLGYEDGDRRSYFKSFSSWHEKIKNGEDSPYLDFNSTGRKFPAPKSFMPVKKDNEHFDIIFLSEFGFDAGNTTILFNEINIAIEAGLKVGILPCYNFLIQSASIKHVSKKIQNLVCDGKVSWLSLKNNITVDLLIIRWPSIMQVTHGGPYNILPNSIIVVSNHAPYETMDERISYDVDKVTSNVTTIFGKIPTWVAESEQIFKILKPMLPAQILNNFKWKGVLSKLPSNIKTPDFNAIPNIGRHARDHDMKWPSSRREILDAYPVTDECNVIILGGANAPLKNNIVSINDISSWKIYKFNEISVESYLAQLDFFVYFHHTSLVEAFGMAIIEAMSFGCVCILPSNFKKVFGDAAVYCKPSEVKGYIKYYWENPNEYLVQQERAMKFINLNCSPKAYLKRLEVFGLDLSNCLSH